MEPSVWIAIYLPLFMLFVVILPQQYGMAARAHRIRVKRRTYPVTNEMIVKYIDKDCQISAGSYGINASGRILSVVDNWIELELKKGGTQLINAEYIQSIKIIDR